MISKYCDLGLNTIKSGSFSTMALTEIPFLATRDAEKSVSFLSASLSSRPCLFWSPMMRMVPTMLEAPQCHVFFVRHFHYFFLGDQNGLARFHAQYPRRSAFDRLQRLKTDAGQ